MKISSIVLVLQVLSLLLLSLAVTSTADMKLKKATVIIANDLGNGIVLSVRCRSRNTDLGEKQLPFNSNFQFVFRPNFWGTTQFFCSMQWQRQTHWFDIYVQNRDYPKCSRCLWSVSPKGPCMFNDKTNQYDICYPWNN